MVIALLGAGAAALLVLAAEWLHGRRVRRVAVLAFGPSGRPATWVRGAPALRAVGAGALAWGLLTLLCDVAPKVHRAGAPADGEPRHMVLVLDVSPSMRLRDAGPTGKQSRLHRARDVLYSLFSRVSTGSYRISVIAVYNGALPVVIDTQDAEVVSNILTDLPMHYAFSPGRTRLFAGLEEAARIARPWPAGSTLLVVVSDGDTVPATGMPRMPPAIGGVLVVGVGDPLAGSFIDGRQSRQDRSTLRQIAVRLGGTYHDGNRHQVPTEAIVAATSGGGREPLVRWTRREYALFAVAAGSALLAWLPWLLALFGTVWRPGARPRPEGNPLGRAKRSTSSPLANE